MNTSQREYETEREIERQEAREESGADHFAERYGGVWQPPKLKKDEENRKHD